MVEKTGIRNEVPALCHPIRSKTKTIALLLHCASFARVFPRCVIQSGVKRKSLHCASFARVFPRFVIQSGVKPKPLHCTSYARVFPRCVIQSEVKSQPLHCTSFARVFPRCVIQSGVNQNHCTVLRSHVFSPLCHPIRSKIKTIALCFVRTCFPPLCHYLCCYFHWFLFIDINLFIKNFDVRPTQAYVPIPVTPGRNVRAITVLTDPF